MSSGPETKNQDRLAGAPGSAAWQRLELGSFIRDIPLWLELASNHPGPLLELGSGAGRVTLPLLEAGHSVIAVEADPELASDLQSVASSRGLPLSVANGVIGALPVHRYEIGQVIGPMQFLHYLPPDICRSSMERFARTRGRPPTISLTVMRDQDLPEGSFEFDFVPDMVDSDGWILSSRITRVAVTESRIVIERLRESVSPDGARRQHRACEDLWRYSSARVESVFRNLGYELAEKVTVPTEDWMVPADLMVFAPEDERGAQ